MSNCPPENHTSRQAGPVSCNTQSCAETGSPCSKNEDCQSPAICGDINGKNYCMLENCGSGKTLAKFGANDIGKCVGSEKCNNKGNPVNWDNESSAKCECNPNAWCSDHNLCLIDPSKPNNLVINMNYLRELVMQQLILVLITK